MKRHEQPGWRPTPGGLLIPQRPPRKKERPVGVSLFSGCGGFDLGFLQAGWHVVAACENDVAAVSSYMFNLCRWGRVKMHFLTPQDQERFEAHLLKGGLGKALANSDLASASIYTLAQHPQVQRAGLAGSGWIAGQPASVQGAEHVFVGDIRALTGEMILRATGFGVGEIDCVFGGPPCQGYSTAGKRQIMDPRNSLVFEFTRLVREIRPQAMVLENVPGMVDMLTPEGIPVLEAIGRDLDEWGSYDRVRQALTGKAGARMASRRQEVEGEETPAEALPCAPRSGRGKPAPSSPALGGLFAEATSP